MNVRLRKLAAVVLRRPYRSAFFKAGVAPSVELTSVLSTVQPATVVDVGANAGQFTLFALTNLSASRVLSFEPLQRPFDRLRRTVEGDERVRIFRNAIGPHRADTTMHVAQDDDSSSLLPISALQTDLYPKSREVRREQVRVAPLSELIGKEDLAPPCLLKIDVQGYELEVLRGCQDLLHCFVWILVEVSFVELYESQPLADEVIRWLFAHGFNLASIGRPAESGSGSIQVDILFERSA